MIYPAFLTFILLSLGNKCYAELDEIKNISYNKLIKKIHNHTVYETQYNPSRSAAMVNIEISMPIYINFKTKKTYTITNHWPGLISIMWLNDSIAHIQGSCGTGCAKSLIFIAPSTVVSCAEHAYRIKNLDWHNPPDYRNNTPLLIDVKKGIYVCYDEADNIQIFPLPKHPTIRPPKGFYTEKAEIYHNQLSVIYENGRGKTKRVSYGTI